jgi:hypothetical protein
MQSRLVRTGLTNGGDEVALVNQRSGARGEIDPACRPHPIAGAEAAVMSQSDVWRCACLLLASYGAEAARLAVQRAMALHEAGNDAGGSDWLRILRAISDLGRWDMHVDERHH